MNGAVWPRSLALGQFQTALPQFVPAVSSVKTDTPVADIVDLLVDAEIPSFLVSAYDFIRAHPDDQLRLASLLSVAHSRGAMVVLDSGRYESYWLRDRSWTRADFFAALERIRPTLVFSYDAFAADGGDADAVAKAVAARTAEDQRVADPALVVPIVHATSSALPHAVCLVADRLAAPLVAVAERDLGSGIRARAATVRRIRRSLSEAGLATAIHVLGTGNPLSILAFASAGADSFDGLEWSQTAFDHDSAHLYHLHHYDLFVGQTGLQDVEAPYRAKVMLHNLVFMRGWMGRVREDATSTDHLLLRELLEGGKGGSVTVEQLVGDHDD